MHEDSLIPEERNVWNLDCVSLTVLLSLAFCPCSRRKLLSPFVDPCCEKKLEDPGWVLFTLHRSCHRPNAISKEVMAKLERRFSKSIQEVACMDELSLSLSSSWMHDSPKKFPGMLWALLRSTDKERNQLGQYLVHDWIQRNATCACKTAKEKKALQPPGNAEQLSVLQEKIKEQDSVINRMLDYIQSTRPMSAQESAF